MAIETKIMQVANSESTINTLNNEMACFGWSVLSIQITHSQNSKTYSSLWDQLGGNQSQTVETTTLNYATITYQRDKAMTNYRQIVALEKEFDNISNEMNELIENKKKKSRIGLLDVAFYPVAAFKIARNIKNAVKNPTDEAFEALKQKREQILEEAEALLV